LCASGVCGNKGAIINIAPDLKLTYKTFEAVVCLYLFKADISYFLLLEMVYLFYFINL
jgi:hypothetical protein